MDECTHLMRDYLCKNPTAINWGYYVMSEDDLSQVLHQLKSFDRPDMYAILKDKIIIMSYADMTPEEAKSHKPSVVFVDEINRISRVTNYEKHGQLFDKERLNEE